MFQIRSEQFAAMRRKKIGDTLIERLAPFVGARWDAQERQVLLRDELGPRGALSFDALGYIGAYTSPLGRTWQLTNAADGKLLQLSNPAGHVLSMAYTPEGLLGAYASTTQARVNLFYEQRYFVASQYVDETTETVAYTSAGDLAMFSNRLGDRIECRYDSYRRLTGITDGNGHSTAFVYDRWNRPEEVLHPHGQREFYSYDKEGRLCRIAWDDDSSAEIASNAQGQPLQLAYSDGVEAAFSYGDGGLLTKASWPGGSSSFQYGEQGQFVEETCGPYVHTFAYDAGKQLASMTTLGVTVRFRWDADSRLAGFTDWSGAEHTIEYLPGDRGHVTTGPGKAGSAGVRSFLRADTAGRLASLQVISGGQTHFSLACSYDVEGRLSTSADSVSGQHAFTYDADSRLVYADGEHAESREAFAYDRASNLAAVNGTRLVYDAANQLVEAGKTNLRWDGRGNLLESSGPEGTVRFRYNLRNQLIASVADDGTETTYSYDALGRRTGKRTGDLETRFFWAGEQMLCEIRADLRTGVLRRQDYLYHPETGAPLATSIEGEVYNIHTDHLGTPRALTSSTGEVVWLAQFSSFGVARIAVDRVPMPLRFRGQYHDTETGLHYNRFRYYAPQWGRYITRDPLTFLAGTNHYLYAEANPLNRTDPTGLISWQSAAVFVGSAAAAVAVGALVVVAAPAIGLAGLGLAVVAGVAAGMAAGATGEALNEKLNGQNFCLPCIAKAMLLGGVAGGVAGAAFFFAAPALGALSAGSVSGAAAYLTNRLDGAEKNPSWKGLAIAVVTGGVLGAFAGRTGEISGGGGDDVPPPPPATRPTWRQSEIDVGNDLGPDYSAQQSFLNGQAVPQGTTGSVRPDFVSNDGTTSVEVKNYNIATNSNGLINNVSGQAVDRASNLPAGMDQQVIVDVRGQTVSATQENQIIQGIVQKSNGAISPTAITFKR